MTATTTRAPPKAPPKAPPTTPLRGKIEFLDNPEYADVPRPFLCKCKLRVFFFLSCSTAALISLYTIYVKHNMALMSTYEPLCDISERVSCTKVFRSRYGHGFGFLGSIVGEESILNLENGFIGLIYYSLLGLLTVSDSTDVAKYQIYICALSNCMSLYLAYLLYFVLDDLCVVCIAIYAINFLQLLMAYMRYYKCVEDDKIRLNNEKLERLERRLLSAAKSPESKKED